MFEVKSRNWVLILRAIFVSGTKFTFVFLMDNALICLFCSSVLDSIRILIMNDVFARKIFSDQQADVFINNLLTIAG